MFSIVNEKNEKMLNTTVMPVGPAQFTNNNNSIGSGEQIENGCNTDELCSDHDLTLPITATDGMIKVTLANSELWRKFDQIGTEMVLTKRGR